MLVQRSLIVWLVPGTPACGNASVGNPPTETGPLPKEYALPHSRVCIALTEEDFRELLLDDSSCQRLGDAIMPPTSTWQ